MVVRSAFGTSFLEHYNAIVVVEPFCTSQLKQIPRKNTSQHTATGLILDALYILFTI